MKKKAVSLFLTVALCLGLAVPALAAPAEGNLPDWYFLFAIFKNVDADGTDKNGKAVHVTYSMSQDEIDVAWNYAREFETYMNQLGVIHAHVDAVEIDATVTELNEYSGGSAIDVKQAAPLLEGEVDLDQYDHITSIISLDNLKTSYIGLTGSAFENGTGHSSLNFVNREQCLKTRTPDVNSWILGNPVHEFLHFASSMNKKWGCVYSLHDIRGNKYYSSDDNSRNCYTDIILNQAKGTDGTGVAPVTWQYPPHVLRTTNELMVPSSVTSIGNRAFWNLTELTRVSISANVTSIGYAAFWKTGIKDVYYGGTEAQWNAIQIGEYNGALTKANIHYNSLMADVKTTDWFAKPVAWALEKGVTAGSSGFSDVPNGTAYSQAVAWAVAQKITSGTGDGNFSPDAVCTRGQIVTFLYKALAE